MKERLAFSRLIAVRAGSILRRHYQDAACKVDVKANGTFVTDADRKSERFLRGCIEKKFRDDGIVGEEFGEKRGHSGWTWIIDPLDGTQSFVCGVPLFGVLIGACYRGEPMVGVVYFPILRETYYGAKGMGAWWISAASKKQRRARVSKVSNVRDALMCATSFEGRGFAMLGSLGSRVRKIRGWGDCYGHMLVATGRADIMLDPVMHVWDCAALVPIIEEAGGKFFDYRGERTISGGNAISTNANLAAVVKQIINNGGVST